MGAGATTSAGGPRASPEAITQALKNVAAGDPIEQGLSSEDLAAVRALAAASVPPPPPSGVEYGEEHEAAARKMQQAQRQKSAAQKVAVEVTQDSLRAVFHAFASYGHRNETVSEMESKNFTKMAKNCKLVGKKLTGTDCDLIFTAQKTKGKKKITYTQWEKAVEAIAVRLKVDVAVVHKKLVVHGQPASSGTKAEYSKFYDDKSTWAGVHQHGGPSTNDNRPTLASQANRDNKANVRGVVC